MSYEQERTVLRTYFESVAGVNPLDNSISDAKITKATQNNLKKALSDVPAKCTCSKRTWGGPCEVCQCSDKELYSLRNFFRVMLKAKKHDMTTTEIQAFIDNTRKDLSP